MNIVALVLFILAALYGFVSFRAIRFINKSDVLSLKEKKLQRVLVLAIPFIWAAIIKPALRVMEGTHKPHNEVPITKTYFDETEIRGE